MKTFTKNHIKSGLFWKSAEMLMGFGVNLFLKLVLAYLVLPEHFGLIGMSLVFIAMIAEYTDLGFGASLVQRNDNELKSIHKTRPCGTFRTILPDAPNMKRFFCT